MTLEEYVTSIRAVALSRNISDPVTEAVIGLVRPHIELFQQEGGTAGQFGGNPALPPDVPWPTLSAYQGQPSEPVAFAASVQCSQLPLDGIDIDVPRNGQLLFFSALDHDDDRGSMVYVPADANAVERSAPEGMSYGPMPASALGVRVGWSTPLGDPMLTDLANQSREDHPYRQADFRYLLWHAPAPGEHLIQIGGNVATEEEHPLWLVEQPYRDWTTLAEFTVEPGFRSGTDGNGCYFFYSIRKADLTNRRFDRVETWLIDYEH